MALNFGLAPKAYDAVEATPTAAQIEAYARASSDPNPRYAAGPDQVAPPVFAVVPGLVPLIGGPTSDPELGVGDPLMIVHGEQEFVYHRPLRPGERLTLRPTLEEVEDKGRGAVFATKVAASAAGEPVVDQYATIFVRGGGSGAAREPGPRPAPPPRHAVAARFTRHVDDDMPQRYAEASGDHNPIHLDEGVARAVGLPGRINHGLGSLSLVAGGLVGSLAGGDPTRLRRLAVRFTGVVFPGDDLSTTVWESDGNRRVFETERTDGTVVMVGSVEVAGS
jgi:acyl dehydratase